MSDYVRPSGGSDSRGRGIGARGLMGWLMGVLFAAVLLTAGFGVYYWFVERVEVGPNEILVLVNKTGRLIPQKTGDVYTGDQVILHPAMVKQLAKQTGRSEEQVRKDYKGIQYEVRTEGRHFVSPILYERIIAKAVLIPEGKYGVKFRRYGRPLPPGRTLAVAEDERGPVAGTLPPGRHNLNPYAYEVQLFDKIVIPEGRIGVQTLLSGPDPRDPNRYVVDTGERGVQPECLSPGTYFDRNPYEYRVDLIDMRSQKYDMLGDDAIEFPSNDGFTIRMEATVEWAVYPERTPWVVVEIGDLEDVVTKVIRPYTMSLARIQGSKMTARQFIGAREAFQRRLHDDLRARCREQGILIKAATVRDLKPPERVRSVIRERELADQTMARYENEIAEAEAKANLVEQQELSTQQEAIGDANKQVVTKVVQAEQGKAVAVTEASQRLEVAGLDLESAKKHAAALLARGQAEARVVLLTYQAEAEPLRAAVQAFGDGYTYAQNHYYQKIAPAIQSILTNTEGPFADVFRTFVESRPNTGRGRASAAPAERGSRKE